MDIPFLNLVILDCLNRLHQERTIYSIYHLLKGKKSAQTIQDSQLFHLTCYFKTYETLTREQLEKVVQELEAKGYIEEKAHPYYIVTAAGKRKLENAVVQYPFLNYLDGWRFEKAYLFWMRMSLLIQVLSNFVHDNTKFFPIQKDRGIQNSIKKFLKTCSLDKTTLSSLLFAELSKCLEEVRYIDPSVLVIRLTGFSKIGLTSEQASEAMNMEETLYHYHFNAILHFIMSKVLKERQNFPILYKLVEDLFSTENLTVTARRTFQLLQEGYSIEEIALKRNLKESTIFDHVVEIALQISDFDISPFVEQSRKEQILMAVQELGTKKLKAIRSILPDANYFEIRLVLAKYGELK